MSDNTQIDKETNEKARRKYISFELYQSHRPGCRRGKNLSEGVDDFVVGLNAVHEVIPPPLVEKIEKSCDLRRPVPQRLSMDVV